jgi:GNAT superfamily N-acetyltransferase
MSRYSDAELYDRGAETLIASWAAYAQGAESARVERLRGVDLAIFPRGPERGVYNNALLARGLAPAARTAAIEVMAAAYAAAGIDRYAAWIHESDTPLREGLERRGYRFDSATRAMGMDLAEIARPRPELELGSLDWDGYLRRFGLPPELIANADHAALNLASVLRDGEVAAVALAFDHHGDCGIYNVETLEHARRQGLGTALTTYQLHVARDRGCQTASLQSTPMAERVYAAAGFRDLGRFLEYVPPQ